MRISVKSSLLMATALGLVLSAQKGALAQTAPQSPSSGTNQSQGQSQIETVVVTGSVSKEKILQTSYAVSVIDQYQLETSPAVGTAALLGNIPGYYAESSGGAVNTNLSTRGVRGDFFEYISLQEDGLPDVYNGFFSEFETQRDLTYDRIEVTRGGPSGILTTNGAAGIVNFISREAGDTPGGEASVQLSSYGAGRVDLFYGAPLGNGLSFTIGGYYHRGDAEKGYGFEVDRGGQLRSSLKWEFPRGSVTVSYKGIDNHTPDYMPQPVQFKQVSPGVQEVEPIPGFNAETDYLAGPAERQVTLRTPFGSNQTLSLQSGEYGHTNQLTLKAEYKFADNWVVSDQARFASILEQSDDFRNLGSNSTIYSAAAFLSNQVAASSAYSPTGSMYAKDVVSAFAAQGAVGVALFDAVSGQQISNPSALNGNGLLVEQGINHYSQSMNQVINKFEVTNETDRNTAKFGILSWDVDMDVYQIAVTFLTGVGNKADPIDVAAINGAGQPVGYLTDHGILQYGGSYGNGTVDIVSNSFYFDDQFRVNDSLRLDAGIRHEIVDYTSTAENQLSRPVLTGGFLPNGQPANNILADQYGGAFGAGTFTTGSESLNDTAWTVGGNYQLTDWSAVYTRWSSAFDTGIANFGVFCAGAPAACFPSKPVALDFGEVGGRVTWSNFTASVTGFYSINKDVTQAVNNTGGTVSINNDVYGAEFDAVWFPIPEVKLDLAGVVQHSQLNSVSGSTSLDGDQVDRLPNVEVHFTPTLIFANGRGQIFTTVSYIGQRYGDLANTLLFPSYVDVDAGVSFQVTDSAAILLQGTNLTDAFAMTEGNPRGNSIVAGGSAYGFARAILPRAITLTLTDKF